MNKIHTALVFPGQGSQIVGMGKDLYENFACARDVFNQVDEILGFKLSQIIFDGPSDQLLKTENTQPALMAVSIAIIEIIEKEFGRKIDDLCSLVAGHSLGEYSALCAAKAISLEDTSRLLQIRGSSMAKCGEKTTGAMAAILGAEIVVVQEIVALVKSQLIDEVCQIANDNSVGQVVISGSKKAIDLALEVAKAKSVKRAVMLPVSGAFHSNLMEDAAKAMKLALSEIKINKPLVKLVANVTAESVEDPKIIKDLLVRQITDQVRWRETMLFMESNGIQEIIEIGSGKVLSGLVSRTSPTILAKSIQNVADLNNFFKPNSAN